MLNGLTHANVPDFTSQSFIFSLTFSLSKYIQINGTFLTLGGSQDSNKDYICHRLFGVHITDIELHTIESKGLLTSYIFNIHMFGSIPVTTFNLDISFLKYRACWFSIHFFYPESICKLYTTLIYIGDVVFKLYTTLIYKGDVVFKLYTTLIHIGDVVFKLYTTRIHKGDAVFKLYTTLIHIGDVVFKLYTTLIHIGDVVFSRMTLILFWNGRVTSFAHSLLLKRTFMLFITNYIQSIIIFS